MASRFRAAAGRIAEKGIWRTTGVFGATTAVALFQAVHHDRTYEPLPELVAARVGTELPTLAREKKAALERRLLERAEALRATRDALARRLAAEDGAVARAARRWWRGAAAAPPGAADAARVAKPAPRFRVLFIGDSLVTGVGGSAHRAGDDGPPLPRRVCRELADGLGVEVAWRALGETGCDVAGMRRRLVPAIAGDGYDVVVLMCGLNDFKHIARGELRTPWAFAAELELLVGDVRAAVGDDCRIVLPALPVAIASFPEPLRSYVVFVASQWDRQKALLAGGANVDFVSVFESARGDLTAADRVHPNESGYEAWAAHIARDIVATRNAHG